MPRTPDHMSGIENAVPKWDFNAPFDWRKYDDAAKEARAKAVAERAKADKERYEKSQRDLKKTMKDVARFIKGKVKGEPPTRDELKAAALRGATLFIDEPSTCFASVTWTATGEEDDDGDIEGEVVGVFHRGGKGTYAGPMRLSEFLEWDDAAESENSVGSFYNSSVTAF